MANHRQPFAGRRLRVGSGGTRGRPRPEGLGFFGSYQGFPTALLGGATLTEGLRGLFNPAAVLDWFGSLAAVVIGGLVTGWFCLYYSRPPAHRD